MSGKSVSTNVSATQNAVAALRNSAEILRQANYEVPRLLNSLNMSAVPGFEMILRPMRVSLLSWENVINADINSAELIANNVERRLGELVETDLTWARIFGFPVSSVNLISADASEISAYLSRTRRDLESLSSHLKAIISLTSRVDYGGLRAAAFRDEVARTIDQIVFSVLRQVRDQCEMISNATSSIVKASSSGVLLPAVIRNETKGISLVVVSDELRQKSVSEEIVWLDSEELTHYKQEVSNHLNSVGGILQSNLTVLEKLSWSGRARNSAVAMVRESTRYVLANIKRAEENLSALITEQLEDVRTADGGNARKVRVNRASVRRFTRMAEDQISEIISLLNDLSADVQLVNYRGPNADHFRFEYQRLHEEFRNSAQDALSDITTEMYFTAASVGCSLGLNRETRTVAINKRKSKLLGPASRSGQVLELDIEAAERVQRSFARTSGRVARILRRMDKLLREVDWSGAARDNSVMKLEAVTNSSQLKILEFMSEFEKKVLVQLETTIAADYLDSPNF